MVMGNTRRRGSWGKAWWMPCSMKWVKKATRWLGRYSSQWKRNRWRTYSKRVHWKMPKKIVTMVRGRSKVLN